MNEPRFRITPQLIVGVLILFAGVVFMLDNFGLANVDVLFQFWPLGLIAIGLTKLVQSRSGGSLLGALIWLLIGTWLLLETLDIVDIDFWDLWPVQLIILGGYLVWRAMTGGRKPRELTQDPNSAVSAVAIMGGVERSSNAKDFRRGDLTAIMGGCELDLRQATIVGGEAVIDTFAFMGGVGIKVPENWTVVGNVFPLMGGFEDSTKTPTGESKQRLVVRGFAFMGGIEVTN